jgi:Uncharacterized conserved protein
MDILKKIYDHYRDALPPIKKIVCGVKYFVVENSDGNIGLAANLEEPSAVELDELQEPNFDSYAHRVAVNAWINSFVNYQHIDLPENDIFKQIDFKPYQHIVMVGLFESLAAKFRKENIPLTIFDIHKQSSYLTPISKEYETIYQADIVIISSTTLANNTLSNITSSKGDATKILMLGPSTPLCPLLFEIANAQFLFGSIVLDNTNIFDLASKGGGTKQFLPYLKKVYYKPTK